MSRFLQPINRFPTRRRPSGTVRWKKEQIAIQQNENMLQNREGSAGALGQRHVPESEDGN